jgi:hypothetical protein
VSRTGSGRTSPNAGRPNLAEPVADRCWGRAVTPVAEALDPRRYIVGLVVDEGETLSLPLTASMPPVNPPGRQAPPRDESSLEGRCGVPSRARPEDSRSTGKPRFPYVFGN